MRHLKIALIGFELLKSISLFAISTDIKFRHLLFEDGLSNSNVNCIVQDADGFIWIGTENGLNRYDGYKFTQYYRNVENKFFSDDVFCALIDQKKQFWIGTFRGLYKYLPETDQFLHIDFEFLEADRYHKPVILALFQDSQGIIWIATTGDGLIKYNPETQEYKRYLPEKNNSNSISSKNLLSLYADSKERIWIGTADKGFDCFNKKTEHFTNYKLIKGIEPDNGANAVLAIFEQSENKFLVGTRGGGIFQFNPLKETSEPLKLTTDKGKSIMLKEVYGIYKDRLGRLWISSNGDGLLCYTDLNENGVHFKHLQNNPGSLINDNVRTIFEDQQRNLWFVSYQGGINILSNKPDLFKNYDFTDENPQYESKTVSCILTDKQDNIWLGTDGGGLKMLNNQTGKVQHFYPGPNLQHSIPDKVIMSLMLDKAENLWIGTYLGGLSVYNPKKKSFKNYTNSSHPNSLSSNFISNILQDKSGQIWIATNGKGLNLYDLKSDNFIRFSMNDTSDNQSALVNDWINVMIEDNKQRLWIGTFWGLSIFDPNHKQFTNFLHLEGTNTGLSHNTIFSILETAKKEIWIGTRNGLNKYLPEKNEFQIYSMNEGLPGNIIYAIQEDNKGNLWLSTNRGLCNLNPVSGETHNYFATDGLQGNEFFRGSSHKSESGELFFGGLDGLNSFYAENINEDYTIPIPKITEFRIFNQRLNPGQKYDNRVLLKNPIHKTDTLVLKHKDNSFSFEFSALDFILPEKNYYRCKMEGFDQEWRQIDYSQRYITYTNLDAGTYIFKVKASSISNKWNETTRNLTIIIKPPGYRTWWAYSIYYLLLLAFLFLVWYISIRRIHLTNQIKMERMEKEKSNELNQAKLRFFTNISHEFRTPITLIVGPLEKMMNDPALSATYKKTIDTMMKNANRLLRLVSQLMDMRKMEFGKMQLRVEKGDLLQFIEDIHYAFKELAEQKNINFQVYSEIKELNLWFDPEKLDKILFNLLSNAFKYTPKNGEIGIYIAFINRPSGETMVRIGVEDNGKGIPKADRDRLFERFYQTSNSFNQIGTGIGLSLTKNLVEIHHGEITFESEENKGTVFNVILPLDEQVYAAHEKFSADATGINQFVHITPILEYEGETDEDRVEKTKHSDAKSNTILIVEDNHDLRKYIAEELSEIYQVMEAVDGKDGLKKAIQHLPDLIIADVMMPEMDGLEMCHRLKSNLITNHIPIILLTARNSIEHRIEGIEQGADSYIPKPFHPSHVKARVKKLIELRNVLKGKYSMQLESKEAPVLQTEDPFLQKITSLILKNIDDSELNIESVSKEIGISRGHLYRKIKLLTDKSPSEFVRLVRLNEAARLLLMKDKSVSEISYLVGFNSPSYFTICFKEHFDVAPSEFASKLNR